MRKFPSRSDVKLRPIGGARREGASAWRGLGGWCARDTCTRLEAASEMSVRCRREAGVLKYVPALSVIPDVTLPRLWDSLAMGTFDRVVVGVDGTDYGFAALRQALAMIPPSATLCAVTALDASAAVLSGYNMAHWSALLEEEAEQARAKATEITEGRSNCSTAVVRGDAKAVLRAACSEHDATLLALGGRSSSRFLGILVGETATTFLHESPCSVLLARQQGQAWHPRRIVVGLDGSESSLAALAIADDLAARLGSIVKVVSSTGGKLLDRDGAWTDRVDTWDPGHPVVGLLDRSLHADLVIVGARGLHGVRALGSVSERVAHRAYCSVLVVHGPQ